MIAETLFFDTMRQALWIATVASMPILSAALIAGVTVGLFQALTSIQEMTLTFVPKLAAIIVAYWLSMSFMSDTLIDFFRDRLIPMIAAG